MKHIPNILTLCNLLLGCLAIVFTLSETPYLNTVDYENFYPILGIKHIEWGAICMLDGLAARILNAHSPIGKDLDSLADMISFGVAPSIIMYKFLWFAYMSEPGAMDTPLWVLLPAFGLAIFAALRLAKFNITANEQKQHFIGLPVPTVGILVALLPLIAIYQQDVQFLFYNRSYLYLMIAILSFLMVSKVRFFKWQGSGGIKGWIPQILVATSLVLACVFLGLIGIYITFLVYILVSLFYKPQVVV
jgi:CDP-diacylglycerol--serine O-phosphatidyltransferase